MKKGADAEKFWWPVPFTRALGLAWIDLDAGTVSLRLPFCNGVGNAAGAVDARAIMAALDHASSAALFAALGRPAPIATLDLRVAFARPVPPASDILLSAHASHVDETVAQITATARAASSGLAVASATAAFFLGASPGGTRGNPAGERRHNEVPGTFHAESAQQFASFDAFLGLDAVPDGTPAGVEGDAQRGAPDRSQHRVQSIVQMHFADRLVGAVALPALHGGVVAALLATAAARLVAGESARRLAAISVQYLRAAKTETAVACAGFDKRGARANMVSVSASQGQGAREVARAQCVFVAGA